MLDRLPTYLSKVLAGRRALAAAALKMRKLAAEVVYCRWIKEVGLVVAAARKVICQHVGVVLQNLTIDELPHLVACVHSPRCITIDENQANFIT